MLQKAPKSASEFFSDWRSWAFNCAKGELYEKGHAAMWNLKFILVTIFLPTLAMSDGSDIVGDRFSGCSVPGDPHAVNRCYFAVGGEVEREMVQTYRLARTAYRAFDLEYSLENERSTSALLQKTQVAFEQYRKLHCRFPEREALGGTASINVTVFCRVELTLFRIEQLAEQASIR